MALRTILVVFLLCLLISTIGLADEVYDLYGKPYPDPFVVRPGGRIFFAAAYHFNPDREDNDLYIHGGESENGGCMDYNGVIWRARLHSANTAWKKYIPVSGSLIPPLRSGPAGGVFGTLSPIINVGSDEAVRNFVTFGGEKCDGGTILNDTWIAGEFKIRAYDSIDEIYSIQNGWKWVLASSSGSLPDKRRDSSLVYLPDYSNDDDGHEFFLLGGDDGFEFMQEAFIGNIVRITATPTETPTGNTPIPTPTSDIGAKPWHVDFEYEVAWTEASPPPADVGLVGHAAVYDPYYGENPRILVYGGINSNGTLSSVIHQFDLEDGEWGTMTPLPSNTPAPTTGPETPTWTATPTPLATPVPRWRHAMVLDIREHRLLIHGGTDVATNPDDDDALDDLWEYDIINQTWIPLSTTESVSRWKHTGCFYWFTMFGGSDDDGNFYDDILEYKPAESGKTWDIEKDTDYGLDDPDTVINTQRVKSNDIVRIHQTQSTWPGDAFDVQLLIPWYIQNLSVIGINKDDYRPVLWTEYAPVPEDIISNPLVMDLKTPEGYEAFKSFSATTSFVILDSAGTLFKNLIIGHYLPTATPAPELPASILEYYAEVTADEQGDPRKAYHTHMLDPGIIVTGPFRIENCEFIANGVGCVMICVSTTGRSYSSITDSIFSNNFVGIVQLETSHQVHHNIFQENALCGILLDKGAHGIVHNNLFVDNGFEDSDIYDEWLSGIFSCYSILDGVPAVQQPFIYNNTFVDNAASLSIWEDGDIRQYVNSPCFFNNIISHSGSTNPAVEQEHLTRCRLISFHNDYDGYGYHFEDESMNLVSAWDFSDDPEFADSDEYRLNNDPVSPCIDEGFYSLFPGVTDMNEIQDFSMVDIGYHFTDVEPVFGPPVILGDDGEDLTWEEPTDADSTLEGYVVYWEDAAGILQGLEFLDLQPTPTPETFEVDETDRDQGYWFGICAFDENGEYGESAFIEL